MGAAKKLADKKYLQDLVPLNALSESRFAEVTRKIVVEEVRKGRYLFRKGDRDNESIYLLDGKINLIDGHRKVTSEVEAGTDVSRYPIANQQPRSLSARAVTKVVVARIDSGLLDVFLTWDQSSSTEVTEIKADDDQDWMTRMLQSEAFIKIPPAIIQRLLMKMESFPVRAGKAVITQGDEGDYFYTIHQGQCAVTRRESPDSEILKLAELSDGDSFGEEALVSDARRNATVTMLTDGMLMRLAKQDFVELLQKHLVNNINFEVASGMVDADAVWVDVRSPGEYEAGSFEDSVNIPLSDLRGELPELVYNVKYIICCDTGRRSSSAAFILSHKGYEVYVLDGGMNGLNPEVEEVEDTPKATSDSGTVVSVEFEHTDANVTDSGSGGPDHADARTVPSAEQLEEISALRRENTRYRQAASDQDEIVRSLADSRAEVERLESALRAAQEQLAGARQKRQTGADEAQLIREQYAALQDEHTERVAQLEKQLAESSELLARLRDETAMTALEQEQLQEQVEAQRQTEQAAHNQLETERQSFEQQAEVLQAELGAARKEAAARLDEAIAAQHDQQQLAEQLRAELEQSRQQVATLEQGIASAHKEKQGVDKCVSDIETAHSKVLDELRQELQQAGEQVAELETELAAAHDAQRESGEQAGTARQAYESELESLRSELERSQLKAGVLEEGITAVQDLQAAAAEQAESERSKLAGELESLRNDLGLSRKENTAHADKLADADGKVSALQQQLAELEAGIESEREEYRNRNATLQQELDAGAKAHQELQQQLQTLQETRCNDLDQLNATAAEHEVVSARLQEVETGHEAMRAENSRLEVQAREFQETLENTRAAAQAAETALKSLQTESTSERKALQKTIDDRTQQVEKLEARMQKLQGQADKDKAGFEKELQARVGKGNTQLEQQELRYLELKQSQSALEEQLQTVAAERDSFRVQLDEAAQRVVKQEKEIDKLNESTAALTGTAGEEVKVLGEQLESAQQKIDELRQQSGEQDKRVGILQKELDQSCEDKQQLEQRQAKLEKQASVFQQELQDAEARSRNHDLDNQEALNKAYEDLNRKNDNEKEMQAQIERLRKKLEQTTNDLQEARDEARSSAGHFREELQAERRERAEERAELAARQKQLKEQLAAVANEHEEVLSSQEGVLVRARDDAREEERSRLQQELAGRGLVEEQLEVLQKELDRAHAEAAEAVQQERERNAADLALIREQKSEADTAIAQIETQLKQLTGERDAALEEQQATREQLNTLRVEVEVARGLMNTDDKGQLEDPAKLRAELEESRRNIEIAVRLRTEAETQRDKALHEMNAMRASTGQDGEIAAPLEIPSLDDEPAVHVAADNPPPPVTAARVATDTPAPSVDARPTIGMPFKGGAGWLGKAIGLGVVAVVALVFWLLLRSGNPLIAETGSRAVDEPASVAVAADNAEPVLVESSPPTAVAPPVIPDVAVVAEPVEVAESPAPVESQAPVEPQVRVEPRVSAVPVPAELPSVAPVRAFRDSLKGGGNGPSMVQLPAAGFLMGSSGNSMNFNERPQHQVDLRSFSISKTEVTFDEYDRFARATGRRLPYDEGWGRGDQPAINVSWKDARAYTEWLSAQTGHDYRLPTEAQWEFAARAGSTYPHWWGESVSEIPANCFDCGTRWDGKRTAAVASFTANAFGLHDIAGNVQEWVEDCYTASYEGAASDGSAAQSPRCTQRVVRGGAYTSPIDSLRNTRRAQYDHDTRLDNLGFRVVRGD